MQYDSTSDLPNGVRSNLPKKAAQIYKSAYNNAFEEHSDEENAKSTAHKIAWSAVKQKYEKVSGSWNAKEGGDDE